MIDLDMLQLQAVKTGLGIKYLSKEEKISILLNQLNDNFKNIVLKGGTALNRGYLYSIQKGRFSEDIDLDLLSDETLDKKIQYIKSNMKNITDFDISKPRMLHRTIRFDCQYENQLNEIDLVQVEFYLSTKKASFEPKKILLQSQYLPVSATLFPVYIFEELLAQKLISLSRRMEGKDIYDTFYGLDLKIDKQKLHASLTNLFKHYHIKLNYDDFLKDLLGKLSDAETNAFYIGNSTNHFIPKMIRPNWTVFIRGLQEKIKQIL